MKRTLRYLPIILALLTVVSCHKESKNEGKKKETVYTTLAELRDQSTSTSAEFSINIKDLVVTAVYGNYAQLEDGTAGVLLNKQGHGLTVGQKFVGTVSGKSRVASEALQFTLLDVSKATASTVQTLPCTTTTVTKIQDDPATYYNRRVKLENVTFVDGFIGNANGSGSCSQLGKQIALLCRPEGITVEDGSQGDLICYPTSSSYYVYDAADFSEHEYSAAITKADTYGVYNIVNNAPVADLVYKAGSDQIAFSTTSSEREFRIQNYFDEWVLIFKIPAKLKAGQEIILSTSSIGLSTFPEASAQVAVDKISDGKLWLTDYSANKGYVFRISED